MFRTIQIIGGGTFSYVRNHLALAAPAFGSTAIHLDKAFLNYLFKHDTLHSYRINTTLTKMADSVSPIITNQDVSQWVDNVVNDLNTKVVIFNAALCDFDGQVGDVPSGKISDRLLSRNGPYSIDLTVADKLIGRIRRHRKDIFLVAFKTTCGATEDEQYIAGLNLLKQNSCNLVLANDTKTGLNMIVVPEEARYHVSTDRAYVLNHLVEMTMKRCELTYTRSTVIPGDSIDWKSEMIPNSLREVVNYCIVNDAYKTFNGVTAGHFAVKVDNKTFLTSKRKTNFNNLNSIGLVHVTAYDSDNVVAIGAKPSVGGQSQRIIFEQHQDVDCIVHFHCPLRAGVINFPTRAQRNFECGSHECGLNTSTGLEEVWPGIKAVYLENHGPNIVFNRNIDPERVIGFIEYYFDLSQKTGGRVDLQRIG